MHNVKNIRKTYTSKKYTIDILKNVQKNDKVKMHTKIR